MYGLRLGRMRWTKITTVGATNVKVYCTRHSYVHEKDSDYKDKRKISYKKTAAILRANERKKWLKASRACANLVVACDTLGIQR